MQPRIIDGLDAQYEVSIFAGENTSGLIVYGNNVLVKMDVCSRSSAGGVMLPDDIRDRMDMQSTTGAVFAVGPAAFKRFDDGTLWSGAAPGPGDRVYVEKHAGVVAKGRDGAVYRIMNYACIYGGLDPSEIGRTADTVQPSEEAA